MIVNQRTYEIVEKAMEGKGLDAQEIGYLYGLDTFSKDSFYVQWAGRELSMQASGGIAEIHAQIGLNGTVCPKNCQFCSFAACNKVRQGVLEMPLQDVLDYARAYEEEGANLILLLTTANFKFEKLLEIAGEVRNVISPEMPLLANTGDFDLAQAKMLKEAGINGVYHAVRMGEGVVTGIPVETRMATIKAAQEAGLKLCTCVEPVGPEHTVEELVEKTLISINMHPVFSGVGGRIAVPGTKLEKYGMLSSSRLALFDAIYRLAAGVESPLNCSGHSSVAANAGANIAWAEVGTNPRDLVEKTEKGGRGQSMEELRKLFKRTDWELRKGPSPNWM
ncbi:MAG TPA: radical SAM protein [Syntrophomonas sp.]|nr:radical SAM protein [Syntrophomonas sp.]HCF70298.1 radical SAM protein [Syntrophomonas sp.]